MDNHSGHGNIHQTTTKYMKDKKKAGENIYTEEVAQGEHKHYTTGPTNEEPNYQKILYHVQYGSTISDSWDMLLTQSMETTVKRNMINQQKDFLSNFKKMEQNG